MLKRKLRARAQAREPDLYGHIQVLEEARSLQTNKNYPRRPCSKFNATTQCKVCPVGQNHSLRTGAWAQDPWLVCHSSMYTAKTLAHASYVKFI